METRTHRLLNQGLMLLLALVALPLSFEPLLFGAVSLIEAFPKHPLLCSLILLFLCFSFFLCFLGSKMESRRSVHFVSRVLLLLLSLTAGLLSVEFVWLGAVSLAVTRGSAFSGHKISLEDLALVGGLILVSLCAIGVKYVFSLRSRYWIIFVAVLIVDTVAIIIVQGGILLG